MTSRQPIPGQQEKMAGLRIAYDNDGLFDFGAPDGEGPEVLSRLVDEYVEAGAEFLVFGAGSCLAWNFRPNVMEAAWKDHGDERLWCRQMREYVKADTDPLTYVLARARTRGLPVLANFRFNRYHPNMSPPMVDSWFMGTPKFHLSSTSCPWLHIEKNPWPAQYSINLAFPEVREHLVRDLMDVVENYPVDGLALELQRAVPFFELDEPDKFAYMNDFVRMLRREMDRIGARKGQRLKLSFWLPTEEHHRILRSAWPDRFFGDEVWGLDPETWIREGLVDYLMPSLFSTDWKMTQAVAMPAWVRAAKGTSTKVFGCGMNLLPKEPERLNGETCRMIMEVLRRIDAQYDGIFLFNTSPHQLAEIMHMAAAIDHPFYRNADEVLVTRGQEVVMRLPCERILLPREESWPSHHIGGHVGRTREGTLYAMVAGGMVVMRWMSQDQGKTWTGEEIDLSGLGAFAVLDDDTFLAANGGGEEPIRILRSPDAGRTWERISELALGAFDAMHVDSNILQLRDGTVLLAANMRMDPPEGEPWDTGHYPQYLFRSDDRGQRWEGGGDLEFWQSVREGRTAIEDGGPEYSWSGMGGTFPGVYETGFCELADGLLLGAFRFSGPPRPWHHEVIAGWGEPPDEPDGLGRIFRHVVLGESHDGGRSWQNLRPVLDAEGCPIMAHGECNGELMQLSDGRLVLVHQTRYAEGPDRVAGYFRGRSQLCARMSLDNGCTWLPERYRVIFGFGYPGSLVLEDDTILTITGCSLGDNGHPRRAAAIRWRLADVRKEK